MTLVYENHVVVEVSGGKYENIGPGYECFKILSCLGLRSLVMHCVNTGDLPVLNKCYTGFLLWSMLHSRTLWCYVPQLWALRSMHPGALCSCLQSAGLPIVALSNSWRYRDATMFHTSARAHCALCIRPSSWNSLPLYWCTVAFDYVQHIFAKNFTSC